MKGSKLVLLYKNLLDAMMEEEHLTTEQHSFLVNVMDDFIYDGQLNYSLERLYEFAPHLIKQPCKVIMLEDSV